MPLLWLFLGSLFYSIDLYVWFCARTMHLLFLELCAMFRIRHSCTSPSIILFVQHIFIYSSYFLLPCVLEIVFLVLWKKVTGILIRIALTMLWLFRTRTIIQNLTIYSHKYGNTLSFLVSSWIALFDAYSFNCMDAFTFWMGSVKVNLIVNMTGSRISFEPSL